MSYFVIYNTEDGFCIKQFKTKQEVIENLDECFFMNDVRFLDHVPKELYDFGSDILVIEGEVLVPKPVEVVKTYEF